MARTRAANPAAEEASPAAVGKLFSDTTCTLYSLSFGSEGLASSRAFRSCLSSRKQAVCRAPETSWASPLRKRRFSVKDALQAAEVCVRRSDWERVTEMEELVGRFSFVSRLPQYLICRSELDRRGGRTC